MKPTYIHPDLFHISSPFKGILLDAYGVFWGGNESGLLPGTKEAMAALVASGKVVGILSNSTQLSAKEINKLKQHGLEENKHFHFLITSGEVAREMFLTETLPFHAAQKRFWVFAKGHPRFASHEALFQGSNFAEGEIDQADFIYIGIPHILGEDQVNLESFYPEIEALLSTNLPMVCANPDRYAHEGKPVRLVVRQGSIAALYEKMGGRVYYVGKPHPKVFSKAMEYFAKHQVLNKEDVLMVGDTPETDIRGALQFGMRSALITQTGIMGDRVSHQGLDQALDALPSEDYPDYFIEKFVYGNCEENERKRK